MRALRREPVKGGTQERLLLACLLSLGSSLAWGDAAPETLGFANIYMRAETVRAVYEVCQQAYPAKTDGNAYQAWAERNQLALLDRAVAEFARQKPAVAQVFQNVNQNIRANIRGKTVQLCNAFNEVLDNREYNPKQVFASDYVVLEQWLGASTPPAQSLAQTSHSQSSASPPDSSGRYFFLTPESRAYARQGQGPSWNKVDRVVLRWSMPDGMNLVFTPYVLFKNGESYSDFDLPLSDLAMAESKRLQPDKWGRWEAEGEGIRFTFPNQEPWVSSRVYDTLRAERDERLDGTWRANFIQTMASMDVGMTDSFGISRTIQFHSNGRFEFDYSSGGTKAGFGNVTATSAQTSTRGQYRLSGDCLELNFDDGHRERVGFYYFTKSGGKDSRVFGLGGRTYIKKD